jgi:glycosyltransferase involved in cell wall biosynthesis
MTNSDSRSMPVVSCVIPVYKGEKYLEEAIQSCLSQTLRDIEVIVIIDSSPDKSEGIARKIASLDKRVQVLCHRENKGVAEAFNTGFSNAHGRFLTRLAQDDRWREDAFELMAGFLQKNPDVGLTYANQDLIDGSGKYISTIITAEGPKALSPRNRLGLCVMFRRSVWESTGKFDHKCDFSEDYDYWMRASRSFLFAKCRNESLLFFRYHENQNSILGEKRQNRARHRAFFKKRIADWKDNRMNPESLIKALRHWVLMKL